MSKMVYNLRMWLRASCWCFSTSAPFANSSKLSRGEADKFYEFKSQLTSLGEGETNHEGDGFSAETCTYESSLDRLQIDSLAHETCSFLTSVPRKCSLMHWVCPCRWPRNEHARSGRHEIPNGWIGAGTLPGKFWYFLFHFLLSLKKYPHKFRKVIF